MRSSFPSRRSGNMAILSAIFLSSLTLISGFQQPSPMSKSRAVTLSSNSCSSARRQSASKNMALYTSLSVPPGKLPSNFHDDDENGEGKTEKKSQQGTGINIEIVKHGADDNDDAQNNNNDDSFIADAFEDLQQPLPQSNEEKISSETTSKTTTTQNVAPKKGIHNPYLAHLAMMRKHIRSPAYLAHCMDDELKRMESHFYRLVGDDLPTITYPQSGYAYNGPIVRPSIRAYEEVALAYVKADLGRTGAINAEDVVRRFIDLNPNALPSSKLLNYVMKAWFAANDLDKAEYWLFRIEDLHKKRSIQPDHRVYSPFLRGLTEIPTQRKKRVANLSISTIEKMRNIYQSKPDGNYLPSSEMYMDALNNVQNSGYYGVNRFDRGEKLLRCRLEDYRTYHIQALKPTAKEALPVFHMAANCNFPKDNEVIEKTEKLLNELTELYKAKKDPELRPLPKMYERVASMLSKMHRRKNPQAFAERTYVLLQDMKDIGVKFDNHRTGAAMLNRVMDTAAQCMPEEPLKNPIRSRDMFHICLDAFKKLHKIAEDSDNFNVQPNSSSYVVFLRAVSKLPEGETRNSLSVKAFDVCRQKGLVNDSVCRMLYDANPALALSELDTTAFAISEQSVAIPESWRKNVIAPVNEGKKDVISSFKEVDTWASMDE